MRGVKIVGRNVWLNVDRGLVSVLGGSLDAVRSRWRLGSVGSSRI
jgi:hypothetical protein